MDSKGNSCGMTTISRRCFIGGAVTFGASAALDAAEPASANPFRAADYAALRKELRAFYPDECHGKCKHPAFDASDRAIRADLRAYAAAHPDYDALDIRRESYRAMRKHFHPFLFSESPFYFEAGVNGGWVMGIMPAREVNNLCRRFYREKGLVPDEAFARQRERHRQRYSLCCGPLVDDMHHVPAFHTVFTKGFKGVREETAAALAACPKGDPLGRKELETALEGLDTIHALQLKFAEEAERRLAESGRSERERKWLERIAESARRCPWEPPRTFFEGLNFLWFMREIPSYVDGLASFSLGRPDAWLIGLYRQDLANGTLTEEEARDLVARWLIISDEHLDTHRTIDAGADQEAEMPVTLGGCDTDGKPVWNELTRMFLDAHIGCDCVFPKLHVRFGAQSPEEYLAKIGDMVVKGHCVFAMFNDDVTVGNFVRLGIPLERARDYVCCGCWDGNVDSLTDVDAANYMSPLRVLEAMIHRDPEAERRADVRFDPIDGARSFEEVKRVFLANFMRFFRSTVSDYTRYGRSAAHVFPHPAYSACLEGCLARRRDTTDGGTRFHPRVMTLAFTANVVDSLCAIDKVCFRDKNATLPEFLDAVRSNWKGPRGEELRLRALDAPYWGDNSPESNGLMRWLFESVARDLDGLQNEHGSPFVLAAWIYREFLFWGMNTKATPDGRHDGDRLAQGFAPSEYRCKEGATAVINAIGTIPHELLYASNANLTFDKLGMTPTLFAAVFRVFAEKGAHLLQPNCNSVEELLDAQAHPERHQNLMVKVCGFSARFVSLSKRFQDEVIARHRLR